MLLLQCRVEVCGKGASKDATDTKGVGVGLLMEARRSFRECMSESACQRVHFRVSFLPRQCPVSACQQSMRCVVQGCVGAHAAISCEIEIEDSNTMPSNTMPFRLRMLEIGIEVVLNQGRRRRAPKDDDVSNNTKTLTRYLL